MTANAIASMPPHARVWVYQANEPFEATTIPEVGQYLERFTEQWTSHSKQLKAVGALLHNRFVILAVDESQAGASGCSIDSSVQFLQQLGAHYQRDLFDRMRFSYEKEGQVHTVDHETFSNLYANGSINDETIVFDPLVDNVEKWQAAFRKPLKDSWHKRFV
ncbi:MAG: hypothetical protein R2795_22585 [Saprospiraceae bacterium]